MIDRGYPKVMRPSGRLLALALATQALSSNMAHAATTTTRFSGTTQNESNKPMLKIPKSKAALKRERRKARGKR